MKPSYFNCFFWIFLFYIPFQERYTQFIKKIGYSFFSRDFGSYLNIDGSLAIFFTDILMLAMIFISITSKKGIELFWNQSRKYLSVFLIICLISILKCAHGTEAWSYYPYFSQLLLPSLFFYVLSSLPQLKNTLRIGLWVLFFSALLECGIAIWQYFAQTTIGLRHLGELPLYAVINMPNKTRWAIDQFLNIHTLTNEVFRAAGTLPHPNILGCFIGFTLLISFYLYTVLKKGRVFFTFALFLQIFTLFITYSRAALIGICLCSVLWFGYCFYKRVPRIKTLFVKVLSCTFISGLLLFPQLIERGGIVNYNTCAKNSDQTRIVYQTRAVEKIKEHSTFGIGFHQYLAVMKDTREKGDVVHNIYILIATETGFIGLFFFILFLMTLFWHAFKGGLDPLSVTFLTLLTFLLFTGLCHYDLMKSQHERLLFFLTCGFLALHGNKGVSFAQVNEKSTKTNQVQSA